MAKTADTGATQVAPSRRATPTIPANEEILVYNGYYGMLTYKSKRNGTPLMFTAFGDSDYVPFGELQTMRSTQPTFFSENWILIPDDEVIEALGVGKYYKNSFRTIEEFEEAFSKPIKQLKTIISQLPRSQKEALFCIARDKVNSGEIDSKKTIQALEEAFGVPFEEE